MSSLPMGPPQAPSLRDKQIASIRAMLGDQNSDAIEEVGVPAEPQWKILVYDTHGKDIIAPLLSVSELREIGVTLYLQLDAEREHIPETTVVYFVMPTKKNIDRICRDLSEDLYDRVQLNFLSAVSSDLLEQLASTAISSQTSSSIERVFDMYSEFICLEHDFFVTSEQEKAMISFQALHGPSSDADMESSIDRIVNSLFCVLVSMGTVPIIRCSRDHAAQMIAQQLDKKLRNHLKQPRNSMFKEGVSITGSFQRPLLALIDRHTDVATIMHHTSTVQALAQDVLDYKLNRVVFKEKKKQANGTNADANRTFDLDSKTDKFWQSNRGKPFPEVAEAVEQELADCRKKEEEIRGARGGGADDGNVDVADSTMKIKMAVSSLPILLEKKKKLNGHMSMLMAIMEKIKERSLDDYYGTEEDVMNEAPLEGDALTTLLKSSGTVEDKLRLYVIALTSGKGLSTAEQDKLEGILKSANCDMSIISYAKELVKLREGRKYHRQANDSMKKDNSIFSQAVDTGVGWWKQGVKKLTGSASMGTVAQIVESLMDIKPSELTENYLYLDPKQVRSQGLQTTVPKGRSPFDECMVFMVGGGNFCEYQNLSDYGKQNGKTITYGCSELVSAEQFLGHMSVLGGGGKN